MGDKIRSTWEIVQEKLAQIGKASPEELKFEKLKEETLKHLAKYLNEPTSTWEDTVEPYLKDIDILDQKKVFKIITETLLKNIVLPKMETQLENSKRALLGLQRLFKNLPEIKKLILQVQALLEEYYQQRLNLYEELKKGLSREIAVLEKALSNQLGMEVKVPVEQHPQFQEEWKKFSDRLDKEAERQLEYAKQIFLKLVEQ